MGTSTDETVARRTLPHRTFLDRWGGVFNASGARGFFGEGYWFHGLAAPFGLRYEGSTFVAKTTTLYPREGNMPLTRQFGPKRILPDCIVVKPRAGVALNAVGLSGPGAEVLIDRWRNVLHGKRFVVSFMAIGKTPNERVAEVASFVELMRPFVEAMGTDNLGLQVNFSCPNVGLDPSHLVGEVDASLDRTAALGIMTMLKVSALVPPEVACKLSAHHGCHAVVCSNTIPWGQLPDQIDWRGLFGTDVSPLARFGGGGLSGRPLLPIVEQWIRDACSAGLKKPIVGGGGILSKEDAEGLIMAGATAVELGSVSMLRPWRVAGIIAHVNRLHERSRRIGEYMDRQMNHAASKADRVSS